MRTRSLWYSGWPIPGNCHSCRLLLTGHGPLDGFVRCMKDLIGIDTEDMRPGDLMEYRAKPESRRVFWWVRRTIARLDDPCPCRCHPIDQGTRGKIRMRADPFGSMSPG